MQWRATIWIMEAFCISPTYRIETIASLISIYLYLNKSSSWQQLRTASLPSNHAINLLLKYHYSKNTPPHYLSLEALTPKQRLKVKSSIIDTNNCLNGNFPFFNFFYKELSPGFRLIDNFPDYFFFHITNHKNKKIKKAYLCKLDQIFKNTLLEFNTIIVILDAGIKNNIATSILYVHLDYNTVIKPSITLLTSHLQRLNYLLLDVVLTKQSKFLKHPTSLSLLMQFIQQSKFLIQ